jgi:serine/threonine protein kinase
MTPERWQRVKMIFDRAVECDPAMRESVLREECGADEDLLQQVRLMLERDATAASLLEKPALGAAPEAASARAPDPMIGRTIGPYRVIRQIGRGGMGFVYLAQRADDQFRRRVALKAVDPSLVDKHTLHRFENERQTLAMLDHPNIIKLIDGGATEDGLPWLVMDYVEGETIDKYCETRRLALPEQLKLFRTVCAAVHYAHQNLVIHRDLKPSNILITPDGTPKLLDFGIAKLLRPEFAQHTVGYTRTDLQPMTPQYASPEQIRGLPITTASDIYSLGVLLYCLVTGRHPYTANSLLDLERAICETEPEKPSTVAHASRGEAGESAPPRAAGIDRDLDMIVLMAMRKEPQRRYASAEHLSEDVRRLLEGRPVIARKDTWAYRARKLIARHKPGTALTAAAAVALAVTGLFALRQYRQSQRRATELRQFAEVVLNMDEGLRSGLTSTRASMLAKAVESLDKLAREAAGDAELQRDLVRAYLNMADVQGNVFIANLGQTETAESLYRKALAIATELDRAHPGDAVARGQVALCSRKIGDALFAKGDFVHALEKYREAQQTGETLAARDPPNPDALQNLTLAWSKTGNTQERLGDVAGAVESYRQCVDRAEKWIAADSSKRSSLAYARQRLAELSMMNGESVSAEPEIEKALKIYEEVAGSKPLPAARRTIAQAFQTLAEVQKRNGKTSDASESIRQTIEITQALLEADPKNQQSLIDLCVALSLRIELDLTEGKRDEAHQETLRALRILKPLVDAPNAPIIPLFYCARILIRTPFADQQNPSAALDCAKRAADATRHSDPEFLELLARAYENAGDRTHAAETVQKALVLLPALKPGQPTPELRRLLEEDLARLRQ